MGGKVFILTHGCSANAADSEIMAGLLKRSGFQLVEDQEKSDLNIINTCTVKLPTEQRMISEIKTLSDLKKPLIVAGCMPKVSRKLIEGVSPNASMIGPDSIGKIVPASIATIMGKKIVMLEDSREAKLCLPRIRRNSVIGIVPVSSGCLSNCTYCSVKLVRGKLFSYPMEAIAKETKGAIEEGCREIYLTSQDNSCYGMGTGKRLPDLINELCRIQGKFFLRIGMMNPLYTKGILDDLIESYKNREVFKFLHLPVQSGSDKILRFMGRSYDADDFIEIVEKFRKEIPGITIMTDIIVGYPGETREDFASTVSLMKLIRPDSVIISKYGPRPMTEAAKLKQLDKDIVNQRSGYMHRLVKGIALEKNRLWIGWEGEVLVDEKIRGGFLGRNFSYKPIVIRTDENVFGRFANVRIHDATANCLFGEFTSFSL